MNCKILATDWTCAICEEEVHLELDPDDYELDPSESPEGWFEVRIFDIGMRGQTLQEQELVWACDKCCGVLCLARLACIHPVERSELCTRMLRSHGMENVRNHQNPKKQDPDDKCSYCGDPFHQDGGGGRSSSRKCSKGEKGRWHCAILLDLGEENE